MPLGSVIWEFFEMMRMMQADEQIPFEYAHACNESRRLVIEAVDTHS